MFFPKYWLALFVAAMTISGCGSNLTAVSSNQKTSGSDPSSTPTPPSNPAPSDPGSPIAVSTQGVSLYVDSQKGSDSNAGTLSAPLATIQAAVNLSAAYNRANVAVNIEVAPGVYRENVTVSGGNATAAPLTLEATSAGSAAISGSDVLSNWTQQSAAVYVHPWANNLGSCAIPSGWPTNFAPIAQRTEMVFVNGAPLTQVMSQSDLQPGTFFVDDAAGTMYLSPLPSTNMATAMVEAAARRQTLTVNGRTNVTLRGLVFRHAANCFNTASATVSGSTNVFIDGVQALWNNWGGLALFASNNAVVQDSVASYNGGVGFEGDKDQNTVFSTDESDYNNWRGAQAAFYDWAMGGMKLFSMRSTTVQNHISFNNQAQGLWFDTDNKNIAVNNATLSGSTMAALQIERNEGPIVLENSKLCFSGVGVNVLTSEGLTVENNAFYGNSGTNKYQAQVFVGGQTGGIAIADWQTGQNYDLFTTGMVLTGNTLEDAGAGQLLFGTYLTGSDWSQFASTLEAGDNQWYDPANTTAFKLPNGKMATLSGWQSAVSTDTTSAWQASASPAAGCTAPAPPTPDFAVNVDSGNYTMAAGQAVVTARVNSFGAGPVSLRLSGLPAGVTSAMSQQSLTSGVVTIALSAPANAPAQTVPVTLFATAATGVHSVTFYVAIGG